MLRLEELRNKLNLSQNELAEKLNMTQQRISAYEKGKREPDIDTIKQLADFFGVTTDYLLGKSDERNPKKDDINEDDVKLVADSGFRGLNEYNKKVAIDIIKSLKAKQDIEDKK